MSADAASGADPDRVRDALREVRDPDLGTDVLASGLIADVTVRDGTVTLDVTPSGLDAETAEEVVEAARAAVLEVTGVRRVRTAKDATDGGAGDPGRGAAATAGGDLLPTVDRVIAVASAKGGVGKTTVAVGLARALADAGYDVGLFDADIHGPNVPGALNASGPVRATEDGAAEPVEAGGLYAMSVGFVAGTEPVAWRGAMAHEALLDLLSETAWPDLDVLVVDLPPGTGDVPLTLSQTVPVDGAVLVTTPHPASVADTDRCAGLFAENGVPLLGAVRNMAGFTCPDCGGTHDLFSAGSPSVDAPTLAELPFDREVRAAGTGDVPEPMARLAEAVWDRLTDGERTGA